MSKKMALNAMFIAFAVILSYVESFIPSIGIPGAKLGLANIIIVLAIYIFGAKEALMINIIRIVIIGAFFGNIFSILFSTSGAAVSLFIMQILKKTDRFSIFSISVAGGVTHNIAQIIVAVFIVETYSIAVYLPVLIISGVITGIIIGTIAAIIYKRMNIMIKNLGV